VPLTNVAALAVLLLPLFVAYPGRTILPLYAASVPMASVVELSVPLPAPFNTLSSLLGAIALLASIAHIVFYRRARIPTVPVAFWLLFLAWTMLSTIWALETSSAISAVALATPLILLVILVATLQLKEADLDALRVAIILSGAVIGSYAAYLVLIGGPLPTHGISERFAIVSQADQTDPNILAASLLLPLVLSIERIILGGHRWWSSRSWRLLGALGAFFSVIAVILTASRGGMLAAGVSFVAALYYTGKRDAQAKAMAWRTVAGVVLTLLALGLVAVISLAFSPQGTVSRVLTSGPLERIRERQAASSGRLEIWQTGRLVCQESCVSGVGIGNFPVAYNDSFAFSGALRNVGAARPAHNLYLGLAVEIGFVGVSFFITALLMEWILLSRRPMVVSSPALKAALIGLLLANVFLSAVWFKYFWLVFLLIRSAESGAIASAEGAARVPASVRHLPLTACARASQTL
jgi:O-antigen ligase